MTASSPAVSPDGGRIAHLGFDDRYLGYQNARLYVMDRKSRQARSLADDPDRTIEELAWAADGRSIYVRSADYAVSKVARVQLDGRREVVAEGLSGDALDRPYTGGALTAWIVGRTHRFRAAAAQKPVVNWSSEVLTTDVYTFMAKYWFGAIPWEDPQAYWRRSPLSLVGEVTTPTPVVVGDKDLRTPVSDAEQYFQALQLRGIPTALVKVPGASPAAQEERP